MALLRGLAAAAAGRLLCVSGLGRLAGAVALARTVFHLEPWDGPDQHTADERHCSARRNAGRGHGCGQGLAFQPQGAGRKRDDRGPAAQRSGADRGDRQRADTQAVRYRALPYALADDQHGAGHHAAGDRPAVPDAGAVSLRLHHGRAQAQGDGGDCRTRRQCAWRVLRCAGHHQPLSRHLQCGNPDGVCRGRAFARWRGGRDYLVLAGRCGICGGGAEGAFSAHATSSRCKP